MDSSRVTCAHSARCGGCPLIDLAYGEQLEYKRARVRAARARYAGLAEIRVAPVRPADPIVGYRARAKLMAAGAKLGLYAKGGGHELVDVPGCRVLSPALSSVADAVRVRLARADAEWMRCVRAIDVRERDLGVLLTLVVARSNAVRLEALRDLANGLLMAVPVLSSVAVNYHDGTSPQVLGAETLHLAGARATFGAFVQAHAGQERAIHENVAEAVLDRGAQSSSDRKVLDLYGGSGAFALALAAQGAEVTLVEAFAPATAEAEAEARRLGLTLDVMAVKATDALRTLLHRGRRFDAMIVNPPRRGVDPEARRLLATLAPDRVAYVSCDPETLARDLDHFLRLGYRADELLPFDMIPLSDHVETLAVLRKAAPPPPEVLYEDADVLVVLKSPHEPTTPGGEHDRSLLERVRALAPDAVPVHHLDVGTSGAVLFARDPTRVGPWSAALEAKGRAGAKRTYLAMTKGTPGVSGAIGSDGVKERLGEHALLEVTPEEGGTHPIRRHLASVGHPVLGDARYGHAPTNRHFEEKHGLDRPFLHCARIELVHPCTGEKWTVDAPLAGDLEAVLARLRD